VSQAINDTIANPAFGIVFFGSIPAITLAIAINWRTTRQVPRTLIVAALPPHLAGLTRTGTGNVPLNIDLAVVETITAESASQARDNFEDDWNRLNLLRAARTTNNPLTTTQGDASSCDLADANLRVDCADHARIV